MWNLRLQTGDKIPQNLHKENKHLWDKGLFEYEINRTIKSQKKE
jgi:hypothetical protein